MRKELPFSSWLECLVITTIIAFGAYLRLSGIGSDFPFLDNGDEEDFINKAISLLARQSLDPGWYGHPGQFTIYLLALSYEALFFASSMTGTVTGLESLLAWYRYDPIEFYVIGRMLSASFAVAVLILVVLIARHLCSHWLTTALAVLLVSISPVLIKFGYFVRPDNQMTFFALIVCLFAIKIIDEPRRGYYIYAGLALGVAISCKYPAVVFAVAIIVAHTMVHGGRFWRRSSDIALSGVAALVAAFLTAPYVFLKPDRVLKDVLVEARPYHLSHTSSGPFENTLWYFDEVLQPSAGYCGLILLLIAVGAAVLRLDKRRGVVAITAIAFFAFIVNLNLHWARWLIPFMPLYLTLVALGVEDAILAANRASRRMSIAVSAGMAISILVLATPLEAVQYQLTKRENSNTTVFKWVLANVPKKSDVLLEKGGLSLPGKKYKLWYVDNHGALLPLASPRRFVPPAGIIGAMTDTREIEVHGIDFIVLGPRYDRYKREHTRYVEELARYKELMRKYSVVFQHGRTRVLRVR